MGNKNLILIVCILLLWFLMIRPLTKKSSETQGNSGTFEEGTGALTPASNSSSGSINGFANGVGVQFVNGLNKTYTA